MKKRLLLPLILAGGLLLAACAPTESTDTASSESPVSSSESESTTSESTETPTTTTSSEEIPVEAFVESIQIVDYISGDPIDVLNISLTTPGDIKVVVTPSGAPQEVEWTIEDPAVISFDAATGVVTGLAEGGTTLTATTVGTDANGETLSDTIIVNVNPWTVLEIGDFIGATNNMVYGFYGILEDLDHTDQFGNAYVTDPVTGDTVTLYGATTTTSALTINDDGTGSYSNKKDAVTTLADFENGELVTGYGVWSSQYNNLSSVLLTHEPATYTYTAEATTWNEGTVTLSKTEDITYGEEITITLAPNSAETAEPAVWVETAYGQVIPTKTADNTYTFKATCVNEVHVENVVYPEMSIGDITTTGQAGYVYRFEGILEGLDHTDRYGNCYVTDPVTGDTMTVYGATTSTSAIPTGSQGSISYTNPRDAVTTLADYENGELVTGYGVWSGSTYNNISVVFESHTAATSTYTASITAFEHGTATLSKESGIAYGEEVTITVTPEAAYMVMAINVRNAQGENIAATASGTNTYTFSATCVNVITIVMGLPEPGTTVIDCTEGSDLINAFSPALVANPYQASSAILSPFTFTASRAGLTAYSGWSSNMLVLAARGADPSSTLDISVPTGLSITDVEVTYYPWADANSTIDLKYLDGENYVSVLDDPVVLGGTGVDYSTSGVLAPVGDTTFSTSTIRIEVATTSTASTNRRAGIASISLTIA